MNNEFRLDRTAFKAMTLQEADKEMNDYRQFSWQERLAVANYLNSVAYNFPINNPLAMDKLTFAARNLLHGSHSSLFSTSGFLG